jgi:hypothetical protein
MNFIYKNELMPGSLLVPFGSWGNGMEKDSVTKLHGEIRLRSHTSPVKLSSKENSYPAELQ